MLHYLLTAGCLSLIAVTLCSRLKLAPSRYKFYVLLLAIISWYLPWSFLKVPEQKAVLFSAQFANSLTPVFSNPHVNSSVFVLESGLRQIDFPVIAVVFAIGLMLFIADFCRHFFILRRWHRKSANGRFLWSQSGLPEQDYEIRLLRGCNNAFTSGLFRPVIWLDYDLACAPVLQHELTHIKQGDNFYLLFLRFTQCLFWWNPLIHYLVYSARKQLEFSCDEACQKADQGYHLELARLLFNSSGTKPSALVLSIASSKNFNIKRLVNLEGIKFMKLSFKHFVFSYLAMLGAVFVVGMPMLSSATSDSELYRVVIHQTDHDEFLWETEVQGTEVLHQLLRISRNEAMDHTAGFSKEFNMMEHKFVTKDTIVREKLVAAFENAEKHMLEHYGFVFDDATILDEPGPALNIDLMVSLNAGAHKYYSLIGTEKHWAGIQHDNYLLRIQPLVSEDKVLVRVEVEEKDNADVGAVFSPRLLTEFGKEVAVNYQSDKSKNVMDLKLTVNKTTN